MKRCNIRLLSALMLVLILRTVAPPSALAAWTLVSPTGNYNIKSGRYFSSGHKGVDFIASVSTTIKASAYGWVERIWTGCENWDGFAEGGQTCVQKGCPSKGGPHEDGFCNYGAGNAVVMGHNVDGKVYFTGYCHLSSIDATLLQKWRNRGSKAVVLNAGTPLGKAGSTGMSKGVHLHLDLHVGKLWTRVDPLRFMPIPDGRLEDIPRVYVDGITNTNAVMRYEFKQKRYAWSSGVYLGTSPDNLVRKSEVADKSYPNAWYDATKWFGALQPGTRYYYKLFVNYGYRDYVSQLYEFTTKGTRQPVITTGTVAEDVAIPYTTERRGNDQMLTTDPERLVQQGVDGVKQLSYLVTYTDGKETDRVLDKETVVQVMVPHIVEYGSKEPPALLLGDANADQRVDVDDLAEMIDFLAGGQPCASMPNANADQQGEVDLADLLWVIEHVLKGG